VSRIVLRAPLRFDLQDGTPEHAPMVLAAIGAIHTRLVLDTGSDVHLLTREVAEAAGLAMAGEDDGTDHTGTDHSGTDHAGTAVPSRLVGDVPITLLEAADAPSMLTLHDVIAIPAPAAFTAAGIGGILSPHRLDQRAYAVVDEVADELLLVDGSPDDVRELLLQRRPAPAVLVLPRESSRDVPIVEAGVGAYPAVPFLFNTGSRDTEVARDAAPGLAGGAVEVIGRSVSGAEILGSPAGARVLRLATGRVALDSVMLRSDMGEPPAMLGQDVLRGTVLAVGPERGSPVLWQVATVDGGV
jgi:hypothetical protein